MIADVGTRSAISQVRAETGSREAEQQSFFVTLGSAPRGRAA